ncbi:conserved hypothetical protein [Ricinus communis]|uniref:RNase H type-1 domain-containing protein n=1 Tax=Ricinus communis TaxID=3988 RepID=B9RPQ1_RICCO|nr:conserved hypothetical protein [Ricinus communis]
MAVDTCMDFLHAWAKARMSKLSLKSLGSAEEGNQYRQKPARGWVKCDMDAATFENGRVIGIGLMSMDEEGRFVKGKSFCMNGRIAIKEAEAMGLKEALSWCLEQGLQRVIFESDAKVVMGAFHYRPEELSEFGSIIAECIYLSNQGKNKQMVVLIV